MIIKIPMVKKRNGVEEPYNESKIIKSLRSEANIPTEAKFRIAGDTTRFIVVNKLEVLTPTIIRGIVNRMMILHGFEKESIGYIMIGLPYFDVDKLFESNLSQDVLKQLIYEHVKKQYYTTKELIYYCPTPNTRIIDVNEEVSLE